jgi:hypothetical protein
VAQVTGLEYSRIVDRAKTLKAGHWVIMDREDNRWIELAQNHDFRGIMDQTSAAMTELFYGLDFCINKQGYYVNMK